jgi:hypothetical protein
MRRTIAPIRCAMPSQVAAMARPRPWISAVDLPDRERRLAEPRLREVDDRRPDEPPRRA